MVSFPTERYGFTSQLGGHATSIRLDIAAGSAGEVEYQVLLSQDLKVLTEPRHRDLTDRVTEVKRMLATLIQTLTADR